MAPRAPGMPMAGSLASGKGRGRLTLAKVLRLGAWDPGGDAETGSNNPPPFQTAVQIQPLIHGLFNVRPCGNMT